MLIYQYRTLAIGHRDKIP